MKRTASAVWNGGLKDGRGTFSVASGAIQGQKVDFRTRFEEAPGTNPEELIAAAHASCFSMALSAALGERGITPDAIGRTQALSLSVNGSTGLAPRVLATWTLGHDAEELAPGNTRTSTTLSAGLKLTF